MYTYFTRYLWVKSVEFFRPLCIFHFCILGTKTVRDFRRIWLVLKHLGEIYALRGQLKCDGTRAETMFSLPAGRVHLNWLGGGRQFSRLLAAEVCASAVVMLDTSCSEVVWRILATHCIRHIPLQYPSRGVTVCHHISTGLYQFWVLTCINSRGKVSLYLKW